MFKSKRLLVLLMLFSCFFILIGPVSADDFYVDGSTTHKEITGWMKNAKSGNNLFFRDTNYNLTDTLVINKAINVKSYRPYLTTKVNSNHNKDMFKVTVNGVNFSDLTLINNGQGTSKDLPAAIVATGSTKKINIDNIKIIVNKKYAAGIVVEDFQGNITNCNINTSGYGDMGINFAKWTGSVINSNIATKGQNSYGIYAIKWTGNIINSKILSYGKNSESAVYSSNWNGKINGSTIINNGSSSKNPTGFLTTLSKGLIVKSIINSTNGYALVVSDDVKVQNCTLSSKKGLSNIYRFSKNLPDLIIGSSIGVSKNSYTFKVYNKGKTASKACHLGFKTGSFFKKAYVKSLKPGKYTTVKITLPSKYVSKSYQKTVKVDYYNKVRESNENNNIAKFKF